MGKLTKNHLVEAAVWLGLAVIAFIYTFEFDQPIEIYRYGASAWPRGVILVMVVAALGQLYWHWHYGDEGPEPVAAETAPEQAQAESRDESPISYYLRIGAILILPLIYAMLLEDVGFYALTPVFIACVIFLMGEQRWLWILGVTLALYTVLLLVFTKWLYTGLPVGNVSPFYDFSNWLLVLLRGTN